jgi:hypothetical protein
LHTRPLSDRFGSNAQNAQGALCADCAAPSNPLISKAENVHNTPPPGSLPPGRETRVYSADDAPSIGRAHNLHNCPGGQCADGAPSNAQNAQSVHSASSVQTVHTVQTVAPMEQSQIVSTIEQSDEALTFARQLRSRFADCRLTYHATPDAVRGRQPYWWAEVVR